MSQNRGIWKVVLVFVAILAVWLASLILVPGLLKLLLMFSERVGACGPPGVDACGTLIARYGATGDLFGAVNALFSGLALASIALTLWVDSKARRQASKPFLMVSKNATSQWVIERPKVDGGGCAVPFSLELEVSNPGQQVALNVVVELVLDGTKVFVEQQVQAPVVPEQSVTEKVVFELTGKDLGHVFDNLTARRAVLIEITAKYTSMDDVGWSTKVVYEAGLGPDRLDIDMLNSVRGDTWCTDWREGAEVALSGQIKKGSYSYGLVSA